MSINLNQTNLDITDPNLEAVWGDLQGNIVKSHGREQSRHIFLKFVGSPADCRGWIRNLAAQVTSLLEQNRTSMDFKESGAEHLFTGVLLTNTGYRALGVDEAAIPADKAFRRGMKDLESHYDTVPRGDHKPTANPLNDDLDDWEDAFRQQIDVLVILAYGGSSGDDAAATAYLDQQVDDIRGSLSGIAEVVLVQHGHVIRNERGQVIEHFGYCDGVSDPMFLKTDLDSARDNGGLDRYDSSAQMGLVLVRDPGGQSATESFGTYFAYRKLQQNIKGFADMTRNLAVKLSQASGREVSADLAGATVVGRFKDSTPVGEQSVDGWTNEFNNFNFDGDVNGLRCPFQSHVRKTNPRADTYRQFGSPLAIESSRRIVRRGISYGSADLEPDQEWTDAGLLFLSCQSDIEQQFIFMQNTWCNNQGFVKPGIGLDPLIGQPRKGDPVIAQKWPANWGTPIGDPVDFAFHGVVRARGGEYFFAPSISFLTSL